MTEFKYRVRDLLYQRGYSLEALSPGCGVHRETLWRGIKGRASIAAIAYFLDMDADELVAGTDVEELWKSGCFV